MNTSANVTSIEAVHAFRAALVTFEESARDTITALELEIRRFDTRAEYAGPNGSSDRVAVQ